MTTDLIDFAGMSVLKTEDLWVKVAEIDGKIGIGFVSPDGSKMDSFWVG